MSVEQTMWEAMSSWFTPTTLFLLLNFMIATIFLTSGSKSSHKPENLSQHLSQSQHQQTEPNLLQPSPSVLQRLKSINFHHYANYYKPSEPTHIHTHEQHMESHRTTPSEFNEDQNGYDEYQNAGVLQRPPSVIQRIKSINFNQFTQFYKPVEPSHNYNDEPVEAMVSNEDEYQNDDDVEEDEDQFDHGEEDSDPDRSIDDVYSELKVQRGSNFVRTRSDTEPASGAVPVKLVKKMKKSASSKSAFRHFSEAEVVEARRPATAREVKRAVEGEDAEVDVKADDFINKFKQQLKLQRLDSILRYKEMVGRGV